MKLWTLRTQCWLSNLCEFSSQQNGSTNVMLFSFENKSDNPEPRFQILGFNDSVNQMRCKSTHAKNKLVIIVVCCWFETNEKWKMKKKNHPKDVSVWIACFLCTDYVSSLCDDVHLMCTETIVSLDLHRIGQTNRSSLVKWCFDVDFFFAVWLLHWKFLLFILPLFYYEMTL